MPFRTEVHPYGGKVLKESSPKIGQRGIGPIHIVEPTLQSRAGHCYNQVLALLEANVELGLELELWIGTKAAGLFEKFPDCLVHPRFGGLMKRLQTLLTYRDLLRRPGAIYLPTGSRRDLVMFDLVCRDPIPPGKVFMLFHWLKLSTRKRRNIAAIARRQPNLGTMAPSKGVADLLRDCGFEATRQVPYPITPVRLPAGTELASAFRYLLFGGAARTDKGFGRIVAFVEHLSATGSEIPVLVQTSPPHKGVHPEDIQRLLNRLEAVSYPPLQRKTETLSEQAYFEQYGGAITLQIYDQQEYSDDRISGVTLDALSCGSPIVATADTWMGRVVNRFGAGEVVDDGSPEGILKAVLTIIADFSGYRERAVAAGKQLQQENNAIHILQAITRPGPRP